MLSESWRKEDGPKTIQRTRLEFRVLGDREVRNPASGDPRRIPFFLQGGYLAALYGLLSPENQALYDFRLVEHDSEAQLLVVETDVPRNRSVTTLDTPHGPLIVGCRARITFDLASGTVKPLERWLDPVGDIIQLTHRLDYGEVEAGGQSYILPVKQETEVLRQGGVRHRILHSYSGYKKFSTSAKVKFQ